MCLCVPYNSRESIYFARDFNAVAVRRSGHIRPSVRFVCLRLLINFINHSPSLWRRRRIAIGVIYLRTGRAVIAVVASAIRRMMDVVNKVEFGGTGRFRRRCEQIPPFVGADCAGTCVVALTRSYSLSVSCNARPEQAQTKRILRLYGFATRRDASSSPHATFRFAFCSLNNDDRGVTHTRRHPLEKPNSSHKSNRHVFTSFLRIPLSLSSPQSVAFPSLPTRRHFCIRFRRCYCFCSASRCNNTFAIGEP